MRHNFKILLSALIDGSFIKPATKPGQKLYFPFKLSHFCMKKYVIEFLGTFFLVLIAVLGTGNPGALATGLMLAAMTWTGAGISGAHFNPAVSVFVQLRGQSDRTDFFYYILSQLVGSILAAFFAAFLLKCAASPEIRALQHPAVCLILAELLGTFALVFVYSRVMDDREHSGSGYYGAAVGCIMAALVSVVGPVSGAVFNPAIAIGESITGTISAGDLWYYLIGSLLGSGIAFTVVRILAA
jgi:aquaporin Z